MQFRTLFQPVFIFIPLTHKAFNMKTVSEGILALKRLNLELDNRINKTCCEIILVSDLFNTYSDSTSVYRFCLLLSSLFFYFFFFFLQKCEWPETFRSFIFSKICSWFVIECEHWCVQIPCRADGGDGGVSQGDTVQPALLQQRCIMIWILSLKHHTLTRNIRRALHVHNKSSEHQNPSFSRH